ncbi:hypothetical protein [uncultured Cetobacterium sp.]|uniref:O-antigen ligase family protein n=1 Tax=uncultured Cetobacterium sp. TaxID=527638 RepID=UPI0025F6A291|nr:hypothetical protein [uncultured Cetobacterium sp.]
MTYFFCGKLKLKKDDVVILGLILLALINMRVILSILLIKEFDDIKPIAREMLYSNVWIGTFVFLYSYLNDKSNYFKEKILQISIYSFAGFGLLETINYYFELYPRKISKALDINRISPLSSESSYFVINFVIILSILLYKNKDKKDCMILYYFIFQILRTFSTTGFVSVFLIFFIYSIQNIKKTEIYKNFFKISLFILIVVLLISIKDLRSIKKISFEVVHQVKKVYIYLSDNKKGDYSGETRRKVKEVFGKNIFLKEPIFGIGVGGIYRFSKYNRISIENKINSDAKNVYWTILAEQGMIGLLYHILFIVFIIYKLKRQKGNQATGLVTGIIVLLFLFNGYNKIWVQSFWMYTALVLSNKTALKVEK